LDQLSLTLVTDRSQTRGRDLTAVVAECLAAGLPAVQVREKDLGAAELAALCRRLRDLTRDRGARLIVNDRVDVALAAGADGVHLGHGALAVADARRLLAPGALVGVSAHAPDDVAAAAAAGADFALFGAVHATPGKAAAGLAALRAATAAAALPVLAIGGITAAAVDGVRAAGAAGVAVVRAILAAPDPAAATRALLAALAR